VHIEATNYESLNLSHAASILMYQASSFEGENIDSDRLDVVEEKGGKVLRDLIARSSPEKEELDRLINELI